MPRKPEGLFVKIINGLVATTMLAGCARTVIPTNNGENDNEGVGGKVTQPANTPPVLKTPSPTLYEPITTPTFEAPTPSPTPLPSDSIENAGGEYTPNQKEVMAGPEYQQSLTTMKGWFDYWSLSQDKLFNPDSLQVHEKALFDDINNPNEASAALEVLLDDGKWHTIVPPKGDYKRIVPIANEDYYIGAGDSYLDVTGGEYTLGFKGGKVVRMSVDGTVIQFVNALGNWDQPPFVESTVQFVERYEPSWSVRYVGKVTSEDGRVSIDVPIIIGLMPDQLEKSDENLIPIYEVQINQQEGADAVAEAILHAFHHRYTVYDNHPEVTYEEYLTLVSKGLGMVNVVAYDSVGDEYRGGRIKTLDPRQGISLGLTNKKLDITFNTIWTYYVGNAGGRFVFLAETNPFSEFDEERYGQWTEESFVFYKLNELLGILGGLDNKCMITTNVFENCGDVPAPKDAQSWLKKIYDLFGLRRSGELKEKIFSVKSSK